MKTNQSKKSVVITFAVQPEEYAKIKLRQQNSTCRSISEYIRNILLNNPITTIFRDQSLDDLIEEIAVLNSEINSLKNMQQELIKKLDQHPQIKELSESLKGLEQESQELRKRIEELKKQIEKITDKWLHS
jgi:chromosome segregation ATPase